jgi:hypothetical protein
MTMHEFKTLVGVGLTILGLVHIACGVFSKPQDYPRLAYAVGLLILSNQLT